jgi:hypothetical protein
MAFSNINVVITFQRCQVCLPTQAVRTCDRLKRCRIKGTPTETRRCTSYRSFEINANLAFWALIVVRTGFLNAEISAWAGCILRRRTFDDIGIISLCSRGIWVNNNRFADYNEIGYCEKRNRRCLSRYLKQAHCSGFDGLSNE